MIASQHSVSYPSMLTRSRGAQFRDLFVSLGGVLAVTLVYARWLHVSNSTTVALSYLLIVLVVAARSRLWVAVVTSFAAMTCINFFFLPPVGHLTIADPQNWIALVSFIAVSLVASRLSAVAHDRAAIAIERAQFLEERKTIEIARKSEELKSALLASLAHDLGTPLTAIRVAASNLHGSWLTEDQRHEQSELVLTEVERLQRLFQNILEMARIDAGAIALDHQWVHPRKSSMPRVGWWSTLFARTRSTSPRILERLVKLDPRLTSARWRTCSRTPRSIRRRDRRFLSRRESRPTAWRFPCAIADLGFRPRIFRTSSSAFTAEATRSGRLGHRHGIVDHSRSARRRERAGMGGECPDGGAMFTIRGAGRDTRRRQRRRTT